MNSSSQLERQKKQYKRLTALVDSIYDTVGECATGNLTQGITND